ncbi:MAG TPA: GxxExxY protein [Vicinamibacterales bacterium]|jgi:GxxExxY protein|nr:GxxExxY protein [Vicinamibacterales bacterium]
MDDQSSLNQTSSLIVQCAVKIHKRLGPGLLESIYRKCLIYELRKADQKVASEQPVLIQYDGLQLDGGYRLDLLVNDTVIVETKAVERILPVHCAQLLSYMRLTDKRLGLLINFNVPTLVSGVKRVVNKF